MVVHPQSGSSSTSFLVELKFGNVGYLRRGGNRSTRRKTSRSKGENQQQTSENVWNKTACPFWLVSFVDWKISKHV